jgi:hypothetical protein
LTTPRSAALAISDAIEAEWHRENYDAEAISRAWKKEAAKCLAINSWPTAT